MSITEPRPSLATPRNPGDERPIAGRQGLLCFGLGREEFGVDLHLIRQIVKPPPVTWVPRAPEHLPGVVSIRGAVITLVDLGLLMGFGPCSWPRTARILLFETGGEVLGLLVDRVTMVRRLPPSALEHNPSLEDMPRTGHVICLARPDPETQLAVIDLEGLLTEVLG